MQHVSQTWQLPALLNCCLSVLVWKSVVFTQPMKYVALLKQSLKHGVTFSLKICATHAWRYSGEAHLLSLLSPRFALIFYPTCHLHPHWPAALHIDFLLFFTNRQTSKGMIYALCNERMRGHIFASRNCDRRRRRVILVWCAHPLWTTHMIIIITVPLLQPIVEALIYTCDHCKTYYKI